MAQNDGKVNGRGKKSKPQLKTTAELKQEASDRINAEAALRIKQEHERIDNEASMSKDELTVLRRKKRAEAARKSYELAKAASAAKIARSDDTRRKILYGSFVVANPQLVEQLRSAEQFDVFFVRASDRELLALTPTDPSKSEASFEEESDEEDDHSSTVKTSPDPPSKLDNTPAGDSDKPDNELSVKHLVASESESYRPDFNEYRRWDAKDLHLIPKDIMSRLYAENSSHISEIYDTAASKVSELSPIEIELLKMRCDAIMLATKSKRSFFGANDPQYGEAQVRKNFFEMTTGTPWRG